MGGHERNMEGDADQRRRAAREARREGKIPSGPIAERLPEPRSRRTGSSREELRGVAM